MKTKQEIWDNYGERAFDVACGTVAYLPYLMARAALGYSIRHTGLPATFRQPRVGPLDTASGTRITFINKLTTRHNHKDINELAHFLRATGADEFAQAENLLEGSMHVGGPRLVLGKSDDPQATTYEEIMDNLSEFPDLQARWDSMRRVRKGGLIGTYSLHAKGKTIWTPSEPTPNRYVMQARMELHDYNDMRSLRGNLVFIEAYGRFLGEKLNIIDPPVTGQAETSLAA